MTGEEPQTGEVDRLMSREIMWSGDEDEERGGSMGWSTGLTDSPLKKRPVVGRYRRHSLSPLPVRTSVPTRSYGHSPYYASKHTLSNHLTAKA